MGLKQILSELANEARNKSEKGRLFERLMVAYFKNEPFYKNKFRNVCLWSEWESRTGQDVGIDIVAEEYDGGFCAIQCKFYEPGHSLQKSDIDSFFTASGRAPFTSRIIVATSDKWSKNAEDALIGQSIPVSRIDVQSLSESSINWDEFNLDYPDKVTLKPKKYLRPHQTAALDAVVSGFEKSTRGKLIMACGTGKTFTSLKIMEKLTSPIEKLPPSPSATPPSMREAFVVFFAPSIALVSQTLKEWTAEISPEINYRSFVVCSDLSVGRKKIDEDIRPYDLAYPPTTNAEVLANEILRGKKGATPPGLTIIFSTYQSIGVLSEAQNLGVGEFDLVICDEAHRTTGVTLSGDDESAFVKVHNQDFIKAKLRLYMTATPRIYAETSRVQAKDNDAVLCSMDDETLYGEEFHRLGFGEAVKNDLLSDYKVVILTVDEGFASAAFQKQMSDESGEMKLDDVVKIIGCWNGLTKRRTQNFGDDTVPMRRAVAFSRSIKDSEKIRDIFPVITEKCRELAENAENLPICEIDHVDGTMDVMTRNAKLDWLKEEVPGACRILSNARCLSEGVDVPSLDAVLFLNPRDSVVDVIQSVGRVMRKSPEKKFGYIILPIGIPSDIPPEDALKDNKKYEVVWKVLQALRSHDDRFNAMVNKIELNKSKPETIIQDFIGGGGGGGAPFDGEISDGEIGAQTKRKQFTLDFSVEDWNDALYAKIVLKCGDRRYWEDWAKDIAEIAQRQIERIRKILSEGGVAPFNGFLTDLRQDINPNVSENDAVEMLAQHSITKPVFDALFENYSFAARNPVSRSMQKILDILNERITPEESEKLERFYDSVRSRAKGVDNAEGKQKIVIELYDKFFRTAFPQMAERLGIVYTPVEVVDFIIRSADAVLREEFGKSLASENVHIIDPFSGTGTFIVRLIQSGLIPPDALKRKYDTELHANEIVLLAYYIAAINIEEAYHGAIGGGDYQPFDGIVLTDTFQLYEDEVRHGQKIARDSTLVENSERANKQKKTPIQVIIGNPPYSAGQKNQNDDNQNMKYLNLDARIRATYAEHSTATNKNSLYDSYIRSIRWATDRIKDRGIICYVSNGAFIDGNSADGMRKCLADEFSSVYCFNLRGNARTSGELRQTEGGSVFGMGTRTQIAISIFVKNPTSPPRPLSMNGEGEKDCGCRIFYHDIGDFLSRQEKLAKLTELDNVSKIDWKKITPNAKHDWINQRDDVFSTFLLMGSKDNELKDETIFDVHSRGIISARDAWAYNFSDKSLRLNMSRMIEKYDNEVVALNADPNHEICYDQTQIKWTDNLLHDLKTKKRHKYDTTKIVAALYRPFCKSNLYFDGNFNERTYQMPKIFPHDKAENLVICVTGIGASKDFSVIISDVVPDIQLMANGQCFPLYTYQKNETQKQTSLFDGTTNSEENYTRRENINDTTLAKFRTHYQDELITKEDIFYYVYGLLHSPEYREKFASDLKKMLPHIPFAESNEKFQAFANAGRELAKWHLNYENVEPYQLMIEGELSDFRVNEMKFAKKQDGKPDKSKIIYNSRITISDIPLETYDYIVNGKSAIEWIMERYAITTHKDSQIKNDPNDWCREHDDPRYIFDLLRKVIRVSVQSVRIVKRLEGITL